MDNSLIKGFKVASVYVTTTIGAGFASGQELVQFFTRFGAMGKWGIVLSGIMFSLVGYIVLSMVYRFKFNNYEEFSNKIYGKRISFVINIAVDIFMFCVYSIMIAGAGELLRSEFNFPYTMGIIISALICCLVILGDIKGVVSLSTVLSPFMIIGMILIGILIVCNQSSEVFAVRDAVKTLSDNWIISSVLYVGYNSILSIVVLCSMRQFLRDKKVIFIGGCVGGGILCLIALILNAAIYFYYAKIIEVEMPMYWLSSNINLIMGKAYMMLLIFAMFTTAVTAGFCLTGRIGRYVELNTKLIAICLSVFIIPLAKMGFSNLIAGIYSAFGYVGVIIVILTIRGQIMFFRKKV